MDSYWIKDHDEVKETDLECKGGPWGEFVGLAAAHARLGRGVISLTLKE